MARTPALTLYCRAALILSALILSAPLRALAEKPMTSVPPPVVPPADDALPNDDDGPSQLQDPKKPADAKQPPKEQPKEPSRRPSTSPNPAPPDSPPRPTVPPTLSEQMRPFANAQPFIPNKGPFLGRLASTPDMFGDSFIPLTVNVRAGNILTDTNFNGNNFTNGNNLKDNRGMVTTDLPVAGGSRPFKNEYARALPTDRVFGFYHHFENALQTHGGGASADKSVDRFTLGIEKTFFDRHASFEIRMPFTGAANLLTPAVSYIADGVGDLVVGLKGLVYADEDQAVALGLAVSAPTGSDLRASFPGSANTTNRTTF